MGLFYNPIDGPPSSKRLIGIVLYCVLALISIWATGESLAFNFKIPLLIAYLLGAALIFICAAMLSIIKDGVLNRNIGKLFIGIFVFIIVWFIGLVTNTHTFYLKGSLDKIQENELKAIKQELEGLSVNTDAIINGITSACRLNISNKIVNYQNEVASPLNPGHGNIADSLKRVVERSMPGSQFNTPSGIYNTESRKRQLAQIMGSLMTAEMNNRINSMVSKKSTIDSIIKADEHNYILLELSNLLGHYYKSTIKDNRNLISKAYAYYSSLKNQINNILISGFLDCVVKNNNIIGTSIPEIPGSIELEHIANTYSYVKREKGFMTSEFLFALLIAIAIDLGAIVIFYTIVLNNED